MKTFHRTGPLWAVIFSLMTGSSRGQDAAPKWDVEIPVPVPDGTPAAVAEKPAPIEFTVVTSRTKRVEVRESPEMPDLPAVEGTINVTIQKVADPGLPDPPPPLPALPPDDPAVIARLAELRETYHGTELVFLSASVYPTEGRTLLRIFPNGKVDKEITAWSNLNFNHFSGFATYRVKDGVDGSLHDFGLLMGIGNMESVKMRRLAAKAGSQYEGPTIPQMPDLASGGPTFVVIDGDKESPAMDTLEQLHDLYRKEGAKMEEAFIAREKAYAARKAYLLANPPKPADVTVRVWKRTPAPVQPTQEGNAQ